MNIVREMKGCWCLKVWEMNKVREMNKVWETYKVVLLFSLVVDSTINVIYKEVFQNLWTIGVLLFSLVLLPDIRIFVFCWAILTNSYSLIRSHTSPICHFFYFILRAFPVEMDFPWPSRRTSQKHLLPHHKDLP